MEEVLAQALFSFVAAGEQDPWEFCTLDYRSTGTVIIVVTAPQMCKTNCRY